MLLPTITIQSRHVKTYHVSKLCYYEYYIRSFLTFFNLRLFDVFVPHDDGWDLCPRPRRRRPGRGLAPELLHRGLRLALRRGALGEAQWSVGPGRGHNWWWFSVGMFFCNLLDSNLRDWNCTCFDASCWTCWYVITCTNMNMTIVDHEMAPFLQKVPAAPWLTTDYTTALECQEMSPWVMTDHQMWLLRWSSMNTVHICTYIFSILQLSWIRTHKCIEKLFISSTRKKLHQEAAEQCRQAMETYLKEWTLVSWPTWAVWNWGPAAHLF